jgi:hypothetical protein
MILTLASVDGLVAVHDSAVPAEERALMLVLNIRFLVPEVGFLGPMHEGLYS